MEVQGRDCQTRQGPVGSSGNVIYLNSRKDPGLNNTSQDIIIRDLAAMDYRLTGQVIRVSDGVNIQLDHITGMGDPKIGGSTPTTILASVLRQHRIL